MTTNNEKFTQFAQAVGQDIKQINTELDEKSSAIESLQQAIANNDSILEQVGTNIESLKLALKTILFESWQAENPEGTEQDFKLWLKSEKGVAAVEEVIHLWISEQLSNRVAIPAFSKGADDRQNIVINSSTGKVSLINNPNHKLDRYWTQSNLEYTQDRQGSYMIFGRNPNTGGLLTICMINNQSNNGSVVNFLPDGSFTQVVGNAQTASSYVLPRTTIIPIGSRVRLESDGNLFKCSFKAPGANEFQELMRIDKTQFTQFADFEFGYHGFVLGISNSESSGVAPTDFISNPVSEANFVTTGGDTTRVPVTQNKYALLVVVGQSNAVGYDESPVTGTYDNPRLKQLGIYDDTNLKVIPLGHHAHSWQDMRRFTNPANPDKQGTKGMHYPLGELLLPYIPENYEILVVNSTYGGTGFNSGSVGTYDNSAMKPSSGPLRWSVESPYYKALKDRVRYALNLHPANALLGVVFVQGENDNSNANGWEAGYQALRADFHNFIDSEFSDRKVKQKYWYFVESTKYWKAMTGYQSILSKAKAIDGSGYVAIPDETDTNAINGTGATSSIRTSHYGNDAYTKVIAPKILESMNSNS